MVDNMIYLLLLLSKHLGISTAMLRHQHPDRNECGDRYCQYKPDAANRHTQYLCDNELLVDDGRVVLARE